MKRTSKERDIEKILFTPSQIRNQVKRLARQISRDFVNKDLILVSILKGSVIFLADLIRFLKVPCSVDFMAVASYGNHTESSGVVRLIMDLRENPEGKDLLLIEDLLDTGLTMKYLVDNLKTRRPRSLKICALLDKPDNRKVEVEADYVGFKIPNYFVVGYGLDYAEQYRYLPYIGSVKKEVLDVHHSQ